MAATEAGGGVAARRKVPLSEALAGLFEHIRFPLITGKDIASSVEPAGLVGDALLFEAYRFHASGISKDDCPRFKPRCGKAAVPSTPVGAVGGDDQPPGTAEQASSSKPTDLWELSLPNGPFVHEDKEVSQNTKESLLDGSYETGVSCTAPGIIVATFPERTQVATITVSSQSRAAARLHSWFS